MIEHHRNEIVSKTRESAISVLPILVIVLALSLTVLPVATDLLLSFLIGALMVTIGMGLFSLGSEASMTPIGSRVGASLTGSRNMRLMLTVSFILGLAVTVAEPDLQVLAETVPHIDNLVLLLTVGVGVGLFLAVAMLRIVKGVRLRWLLIGFYAFIFLLAILSDDAFLGVSFDAGGVTTGPMTVPFILAFGVGISKIRSDSRAESDSFGLVALCSIGPILAVMALGFFYDGGAAEFVQTTFSYADSAQIGRAYIAGIPKYMGEMALALFPIIILFLLFQLIAFRMRARAFWRIALGIGYTYIGLVLFLTGVNVGFSALGSALGAELVAGSRKWLLVPLSMLLGWFIISAEPAVYVLEKQIEEVSAGAISGRAIKLCLSAAVSLAMGMAALRVLTGMSILWFLAPGYTLAVALSFFVPDIYTAIAFDSGGVASGPMTATFMLQFMIGASGALGGNVLSDAFGIVALVAMMPLISVQALGFVYGRRTRKSASVAASFGDTEVIELWEVAE